MIAKSFWKIRKERNISKCSDQIVAYFVIKQYTNLKMTLKIIKKSPECLFDEESFKNYFQINNSTKKLNNHIWGIKNISNPFKSAYKVLTEVVAFSGTKGLKNKVWSVI